uniref:NADP-dependent oxidoreductase domain-containing protein n=1 Tax=Timema cristinae TaxID=61476 RepID=A0A7R9GU05_TIMCR|nr:unnamed protein product [Timema cristinae]
MFQAHCCHLCGQLRRVGTYKIRGSDVIFDVIDEGLKAGYRSIDTAAVYHNEEDIGRALKELLPKYNLTREDIFVTSKLSPSDHCPTKVAVAARDSLARLDTPYLDLYLVHWPGVAGVAPDSANNPEVRIATWQELVSLHRQGLFRSIGVSNYTKHHLVQILANSAGVRPAVNQVEFHPHYKQPELLNFCYEEGVLLQAYSSLGGSSNHSLLEDPTVSKVAESLGRSPSQVLLRWALKQRVGSLTTALSLDDIDQTRSNGRMVLLSQYTILPLTGRSRFESQTGVIPKSVHPDRIAENIDLDFEIPQDSMRQLSSIQMMEKYAWDPNVVA